MSDFPLLHSLFDEPADERRPLSVSELNAAVKAEVERRFAEVWVEGEIVNFVAARSGHWYFTLHDAASQIRAACYRGANSRIRFQPFDGLQVRVRGRLTLYEPKGEFQLMVESLEPIGEGALKVAFEQIKSKLAAEGLFDDARKRRLPAFPRRIGVVTSPTGAAFFDILHVLSRRARSINVLLIPTRVQGETAGDEICSAVRAANEFNRSAKRGERIEVLIVGRGGGSSEDLWAFNEEHVARAIRESEIPVISAVGHEIDFTIADFAADRRAPTPSAAAEIVARAEEDVLAYLERRENDLVQILGYQLLAVQTDLQALALSPVFVEFPNRVRGLIRRVEDCGDKLDSVVSGRIDALEDRLMDVSCRLSPLQIAGRISDATTRLALLTQRHQTAAADFLAAKNKSLKLCMATLDALSPLAVLNRGFSITENESGTILRSTHQTKAGEKLNIRLARGKLRAEVTATEEDS